MTIKGLVDRGLEVKGQLKVLQEELKAIEGKLAEAGLCGEQVPLKDPEREGKRFLARGSGVIVPVVFTADSLVGTFKRHSALHQRIEAASGGDDVFLALFRPWDGFERVIEDGKKFRAEARQLAGAKAPALITACLARDKNGTPKNTIKVCWEDAEPVGGS